MKHKFIVFTLLMVMLALSLLSSVAYAADGNLDGYDDNDFDKMQAFLDQPSGVSGKGQYVSWNCKHDLRSICTKLIIGQTAELITKLHIANDKITLILLYVF